jgi:hypothetical protein
MKVVLVWGRIPARGKILHWAYVTSLGDSIEPDIVKESTIGDTLFRAANREEITDPNLPGYYEVPKAHPKAVCRQWIENHNHTLSSEVVLCY